MMRFLIVLLLMGCSDAKAFGQQSAFIQKDKDNNVVAIFSDVQTDQTDREIIQKGVENLFFIYNIHPADSTISEFYSSQQGRANRVFSILTGGNISLFQQVTQQGNMNQVEILQVSAPDSLDAEKNRVNVKQKGTGNSATIIQN